MPARAAVMPLGKAPPLGEPPPPPTPQLRLANLTSRAAKLKQRGHPPGAVTAFLGQATRRRGGGKKGPAEHLVDRAPATRRQAAKQEVRDRASATAAATPKPGLAAAVASGAGEAVVERAKESARLRREAARAASKATSPQRAAPVTRPVTSAPTAPKPARTRRGGPGYVVDAQGRQVGHLKGPATNAPKQPKAEADRVGRFFGEGERPADKPPRAPRQPRKTKQPEAQPVAPTTLEQQRDAQARVDALKARVSDPSVLARVDAWLRRSRAARLGHATREARELAERQQRERRQEQWKDVDRQLEELREEDGHGSENR